MISFIKDRTYDLITMGRVGVDLYAEQIQSPLNQVQSFKKSLGGTPANIAVGTSRLALNSALFSAVGNDELGVFLKDYLMKEKVSIQYINTLSDKLTAMVILGIQPPDKFPLIFYRQDCADLQLSEHTIKLSDVNHTTAFLFTGTGLSTERLRRSTKVALTYCKQAQTIRIFDLDYRPVLWGVTNKGDGETRFKQCAQVTKHYQKFLSQCDLIVGTEEELCIASGVASVEAAIANIKARSSAIIVYKRGLEGSTVYFKDSSQLTVSTFPVKIYNTLGAGDAYLSGLLAGLIKEKSWRTALQWGNAAGAIVCSRHGCAPAMPTLEEIQYFLTHYPKQQQRIVSDKQLKRLHLRHTLGKARAVPSCFLAYDHRWQFEASCQEYGVATDKIIQFKSLVYQGVCAMQPFDSAIHGKAIICDPQYGEHVLIQATRQDTCLFVPVEAANHCQLQWIESNLSVYEILLKRPTAWGVKVLWIYHPDLPDELKSWQLMRLQELASACESLERKLMLELILPEGITVNGQHIAQSIRDVYCHEIFPFWWKLQPVSQAEDWQCIDATIVEFDQEARIILLGGQQKSLKAMKETFHVAQSSQLINGFAIGRNLFWSVWEDYIQGQLNDQGVIEQIQSRYQHLFNEWELNHGYIKESINSCE